MVKRILLFVITNLAVAAMLMIVVAVLGAVGFAVGPTRLPLAPLAAACLALGMGGSLVSLLLSRWSARKLLGVRLVDEQTPENDLQWLRATVTRLASRAHLPQPRVGVYDSTEVNALATGPSRKRSLVAVSSGLLHNMSREEVEGVLGHELAHVANGDMVTMALLQGVMNVFVLSCPWCVTRALRGRLGARAARVLGRAAQMVLLLLLGLLGALTVAWYSRRREFRADAAGARLVGRSKVQAALRQLTRTRGRVEASPDTLAALKISGRDAWLEAFSTHPPLEARLAALERLPDE